MNEYNYLFGKKAEAQSPVQESGIESPVERTIPGNGEMVSYWVVMPEEGSIPLAMFLEKLAAEVWMGIHYPFGTKECFKFWIKK